MNVDMVKIGESVAEVTKGKAAKCPHCGADFYLRQVAAIPAKQIFTMTLESESGSFSARTVGETIANIDRLMKAVAKDIGGKVEMFIDSMEKVDNKLRVSFLVVSAANQPKNGKGAALTEFESKQK
jgi:hypothetical protein